MNIAVGLYLNIAFIERYLFLFFGNDKIQKRIWNEAFKKRMNLNRLSKLSFIILL